MKKLLLFPAIIISAFLFSSCKKDSTATVAALTADNSVLRYEFSADHADAYGMHGSAGYINFDEFINDVSWSKTIKATRTNPKGPDLAVFTVTAPESWIGTTNSAHIQMKIFLDDKEIASKDAVLEYVDRSNTYTLSAAY